MRRHRSRRRAGRGSQARSPRPPGRGAWRAVAAGQQARVVAPTGSGKPSAAFLWALDRLATDPAPADVERNLRAPLAHPQAAIRLGRPEPAITVGMRTGDTSATERRAFARTPPDILVATPESLFLPCPLLVRMGSLANRQSGSACSRRSGRSWR
ncbi:DEAD/DEAH box helicase [Streptomyces sp. NPDC020192]|uniref:DEAD/DEAH box helicase n=1 Tax=Streptomyces sp. NPDC020192 TaxID=3365066 RepID=UPI0037BB6587